MDRAIGVMARAPSAAGKTRLAAHLTGARLRSLREALLRDTLALVAAVRDVRRYLFFTPPDTRDEIAAFAGETFVIVPQRGDDLGERMRSAFEEMLTVRRHDVAVLVGTDIPLLRASDILDACAAVCARDAVVLGPADDGGYYLIAMRMLRCEVFGAIEWGSDRVFDQTRRAAERAGIEVQLTRACYDVDTMDDLRRVERDLAHEPPNVASHLRAWITQSSVP